MVNSSLCPVCLDYLPLKNLPCGCQFCLDCLQAWFTEQINQKIGLNHDLPQLNCPNDTCQNQYHLHQLYTREIQIRDFTLLDELITKKSIFQDQYFRSCPSNDCKYIGFINKQPCRNKFVCDKCKFEWFEKDMKTWDMKLKENALNLLTFNFQETATVIYENIMTNECLGCEMRILKNGGCPHMTCKKCGYEFCWICLQPQGKFGKHLPNICFFTFLTKILIILLLLILLSIKLRIFSFIWLFIKSSLYYLFVYIIVLNSIIPLSVGLCSFFVSRIKQRFSKRNYYSNIRRNQPKLVASMLFFFQYILSSISLLIYLKIIFSYWSIWEVLSFYLKELIVAGIGYVIGIRIIKLLQTRF